MAIDAWIALGVVVAAVVVLVLDRFTPDLVLFAGVTVLILTGTLTTDDAIQGFANPAVLTIAALFIVSAAVRSTGLLDTLTRVGLGGRRGEGGILTRIMLPVSAMSAFLNNVPIVLMLTPVIADFARKRGLAASRLLIPLSYAALLGGMCTLIGTSTNLIVDGIMRQHSMHGMGMFEITAVGVPVAIVGWLFMVTAGRWLLPVHKPPMECLELERRDFVTEMILTPGSPLAGQTVEHAGLTSQAGLCPVQIMRGDAVISPVDAGETLEEGDRLVFVGVVATIKDLLRMPGLVTAAQPHDEFVRSRRGRLRLVEAVVSASSPLVGLTLRQARFRDHYDAVVLAVHRNAQRVDSRFADVVILAGDTLLIMCEPVFVETWYNSPDFSLVSDVGAVRWRTGKAWLVAVILAGMVALAALGGRLPKVGGQEIGMFHAAWAAALLLMATGCVTRGRARAAVNLQVLIVIGCALGIGRAMETTGAAKALAAWLVGPFEALGPVGVLAGVYLFATVMCEVVSSKAAVAIVAPIAFAAAQNAGADPRPFAFATAIASCAAFMFPVADQTNLIVYGPGGYRTLDFVRVGLPLKIIVGIVAVTLIPIIWPL